MRMMLDAPFYYVFPDLSGEAVADSSTYRLSPDTSYELAYRVYGDKKYAWLLNRAEEPRRPESDIGMMWFSLDIPQGCFDLSEDTTFSVNGIHKKACALFPSGGYSILRQDTTRDVISVLTTYGKYGSGHDHPDKLHISLYGAGKIIAPDAGSLGYGNQEHLTWAKQTIAHNTVTVDEVSQHPQGTSDSMWEVDSAEHPSVGRPLLFHAGERLKAMQVDCDNAYAGVILDRTVVLVDSRVFGIYRVGSKEVHQYDYALHIDGELCSASLKLVQHTDALSPNLGYAHITNTQRGCMNQKPCHITYRVPLSEGETDAVQMRVTFLPMPGGTVILGNGLGTEGTDEGKPVAIIRTHAANADFIAIVDVAQQSVPGIVSKRMPGMLDGVICLEADDPDGGKTYLVSAEKPQGVRVAEAEFEGLLALI